MSTEQVAPLSRAPAQPGLARGRSGGRHRMRAGQLAFFALPVTISSALAAAVISRWPFGRTEVASVSVAHRSFTGILQVLRHTDAPLGLYYVLLHFWLLLGSGEGSTRVPSALFGVGAVAVTMLLARKCYGPAAAMVAGILMALSGFAVGLSVEARPYSLMMCLATAATLLFLRAAETPTALRRTAYGVVAVLAIYAQFFTCLVVVAHVLVLIARDRRLRRKFVLVYGVVFSLAAPLIVFTVTQQSSEVNWIPPTRLSTLREMAVTVTGGRALAVVLAGLALLSATRAARTWVRSRDNAVAWSRLTIASCLVVPPAVIVCVSLIKPLLVARYFAETLPPLAIAAAASVVSVRRPLLQAAVGTVIAGFAASVLWHTVRLPFRNDDPRAAAQTVGQLSQPGDAIAFAPAYWRSAFDFYFQQLPTAQQLKVSDVAFQTSAEKAGTLYATEISAQSLAHRLRGRTRLWVIGDPTGQATKTTTPEPMLAFEHSAAFRAYHQVHVFTFGSLNVYLFALNPISIGGAP